MGVGGSCGDVWYARPPRSWKIKIYGEEHSLDWHGSVTNGLNED